MAHRLRLQEKGILWPHYCTNNDRIARTSEQLANGLTMHISDFDYDLPEELIAQYPLKERSSSRLLTVNGCVIEHKHFTDILSYVNPGDLMVFNQSRVIKARLFGQKETGGQLEVLIERVISSQEALAHIKCSKSPKPGSRIKLADAFEAEVAEKKDALFRLCLIDESHSWFELLDQYGHMPLPPYMHREDEESDIERYQTVYAKDEGSVAAPTAGLHFDQTLLDQLQAKGIEFGHVTLHVGAGTFQPVRVDDIAKHHMHSEWIDVPAELCEQISQTKARGNKVIAVGTTTVRSLESAALSGELKPYQGETDIFIYPGFEFKVVDAMITNFHLPKSTLLMLVSAFSGQENMLKAYREAVDLKYRFFSYGDAMLLT